MTKTQHPFIRKYIFQKVIWTILVLLVVVVINILLNKYAGEHFNNIARRLSGNYLLSALAFFISEITIGIFPAELFMMIYQSKEWDEFFWIVFTLGIISAACGFIAFLAGRYLNHLKVAKMVLLQQKFKKYGDLFQKYGWVIIILAATTPLPFALVCFIAGYFKYSPVTFLKIIVPVRIVRFIISAYFIKYSISLF
jgi:uncharacterized membrane protein YdjX (TVP38/TMEM64 family)